MNNFMQGAGGSYPINLPQLDAGQLLSYAAFYVLGLARKF